MSHLQPVVGILRRCMSREEGVVINTAKIKTINEYEQLIRLSTAVPVRITEFLILRFSL